MQLPAGLAEGRYEVSNLPPDAHNVLGTILGVKRDLDWREGDYEANVQVCVEFYEGQKMAYFAALSESGTTVRVDLDAEGWRKLADLASEAADRAGRAEREELEPLPVRLPEERRQVMTTYAVYAYNTWGTIVPILVTDSSDHAEETAGDYDTKLGTGWHTVVMPVRCSFSDDYVRERAVYIETEDQP